MWVGWSGGKALGRKDLVGDVSGVKLARALLGIVINKNDAETVWNAFKLGNVALRNNHAMKVSLLAKVLKRKILTMKNLT